MDEDERKRRAVYEQQTWLKKMREDDPVRASLYCDHASYIGFGGLFRNKCTYCMGENYGF